MFQCKNTHKRDVRAVVRVPCSMVRMAAVHFVHILNVFCVLSGCMFCFRGPVNVNVRSVPDGAERVLNEAIIYSKSCVSRVRRFMTLLYGKCNVMRGPLQCKNNEGIHFNCQVRLESVCFVGKVCHLNVYKVTNRALSMACAVSPDSQDGLGHTEEEAPAAQTLRRLSAPGTPPAANSVSRLPAPFSSIRAT